jgi:hypothetical protein
MPLYILAPIGDSSPGVAPGGLTNQYLRKASDLDFDTDWEDLPDGLSLPSQDLLVVNLSGSQSDPTAANAVETFTFQWPAQILASALSAETAASGSAFEVNARLNASSIYSVRPQIAVGSTTGSSGTLAITTAAAGDILRFDISQAGGGCRLAKLYLTVRRADA